MKRYKLTIYGKEKIYVRYFTSTFSNKVKIADRMSRAVAKQYKLSNYFYILDVVS